MELTLKIIRSNGEVIFEGIDYLPDMRSGQKLKSKKRGLGTIACVHNRNDVGLRIIVLSGKEYAA